MQIFHLKRLGEQKGILQREEAHHCVKVLRHAVGDAIHTIDGTGNYFPATIKEIQKDKVLLELGEAQSNWGEIPYHISIGISPLTKKDRFEWFLEKSVELGIGHITPILCKRTGPGRLPKPERMEKILLAATKQSKRSRIPTLNSLVPFERYLSESQAEVRMLAWCKATEAFQAHKGAIMDSHSLDILIGPEGDFTDAEVDQAIDKGLLPISLGHNRLRTETAALFTLSALKTLLAY